MVGNINAFNHKTDGNSCHIHNSGISNSIKSGFFFLSEAVLKKNNYENNYTSQTELFNNILQRS